MVASSRIRSSTHEGFVIQSSAFLREESWYPAYEISWRGDVIAPWRSPDIDGRGTENAACEWAKTLAVNEIEMGFKKIYF